MLIDCSDDTPCCPTIATWASHVTIDLADDMKPTQPQRERPNAMQETRGGMSSMSSEEQAEKEAESPVARWRKQLSNEIVLDMLSDGSIVPGMFNGNTACFADLASFPSTEEELVEIIKHEDLEQLIDKHGVEIPLALFTGRSRYGVISGITARGSVGASRPCPVVDKTDGSLGYEWATYSDAARPDSDLYAFDPRSYPFRGSNQVLALPLTSVETVDDDCSVYSSDGDWTARRQKLVKCGGFRGINPIVVPIPRH